MPTKPPTFRLGPKPKPVVRKPGSTARGYDYAWQKLRLTVLARDHYLCQPCLRRGKLAPVGKSGHVDHIVPKAQGGTDAPSNLEASCVHCNTSKAARDKAGARGVRA